MSYIYNLVDTWNDAGTTFTSIKMNVTDTASNAASLLMDLQVGGVSRFNVSKGAVASASRFLGTTSASIPSAEVSIVNSSGVRQAGMYLGFGGVPVGFTLNNVGVISWDSSSAATTGTPDLYLTRRAAANLRLGNVDAAAPVAQTLSVQSVVAGTTNTAGTALTITGSQGTGTGAGGSIIFQVAPAGSSGSAQNALATALTIDGSTRGIILQPGAFQSGGISFAGSTANIYSRTLGSINIGQANTLAVEINYPSLGLSSDYFLGWSELAGSTGASGTKDVRLYRDAANTLALRNGTAAQAFRVYRTTDGTNYECLSINALADKFTITSEKGGTGAARDVYLYSNAALWFGTADGGKWTINTSGHFLAGGDNTYDIGASGATRPRNLFLGSYAQLSEMTAPAAPAANGVRIYAVDNGSGKTQLMALFATGAAQQIAIEP